MDDPRRAAEDFLGLLLGDLQVRRLLGVVPAPEPAEVEARVIRATRAFVRLHAA